MTNPTRLAVFVSGGGTNLQTLIDHFNLRDSSVARVALVVSSRDGVPALERAERAGIPTRVIDPVAMGAEAAELAMLDALSSERIGLIALAGYIRLVPASVVARYSGAMLNIHPALLPSFGGKGMYGSRVHEAVLASGARVSGATVHLVDDGFDEGRIVAQWPVPVWPGDTSDALAARVLQVEHRLYPAAIEAMLGGVKVVREPSEDVFELVAAGAPNPESVRRLSI